MAARKSETPKPRKPRKPRKKATAPSKNFATKIANGAAAFLAPSGAIDGRSLPARRFAELSRDIISDRGGIDALSAIEKQLIKRFVGASVIAELAEAKLASGGSVDVAQYATLANTANRLAGTIGTRRAVIDATPTLEVYLAARAAQEPPDSRKGEDDEGDGEE